MTIDQIYTFILELMRKNQAGGLSASEFNDFWNDAQYAYLSDLTGRFNAKNNSKSGVNTGLIQTEVILAKLAPFTKPVNLTVATGVVNKPDDFYFRLAIRRNGYAVKYVNKNSISRMLKDPIDPPSEEDNIYYFTEYINYYQFFPSTIPNIDLDYISLPVSVRWGFKFDADGREIYDQAASQDSGWDTVSNMEISKRMMTDLGVSFKDGDFANFGNTAVVTGE